jgi:lauroyl/myristoyl acyltransferase
MMLLASYQCLKFVFRYLVPPPLRYPLARWIARGICRFNPRRRETLVSNLAPLVGEARARELTPVLMGNFLMTAVDFFCSRPELIRQMSSTGWEHADAAYKKTGRVIIATAHMGNWEIGTSYLVNKGHRVVSVYATYTEDAIVQWILAHRNPKVEWIPATPGAADSCVKAIENGRILGIAADIPYGEHGRRVTIAGRSARLPVGPWSIALRAGATVLPAFILRESPGRYRAIIHEPIDPGAGTLKQRVVRMQDAYRGYLEQYLRAYPEQWGYLQPFWEPSAS